MIGLNYSIGPTVPGYAKLHGDNIAVSGTPNVKLEITKHFHIFRLGRWMGQLDLRECTMDLVDRLQSAHVIFEECRLGMDNIN